MGFRDAVAGVLDGDAVLLPRDVVLFQGLLESQVAGYCRASNPIRRCFRRAQLGQKNLPGSRICRLR